MAKTVRAMKNGDVQVRCLVLQGVVDGDLGRVGPDEDLVEAQEEGNRGDADERNRPSGGLEDAPRRETPAAARQMLQHQEAERADRHRVPEQPADEIGLEELLARQKEAGDRSGGAGGADDERPCWRGRKAPRAPRSQRCGAGIGASSWRDRGSSRRSGGAGGRWRRVGQLAGRGGHGCAPPAACRGRRRRTRRARRAFRRRETGDLDVLRELQRPDVGGDRPAILRRNLRGVARHDGEAVRHHVEEVSDRNLPRRSSWYEVGCL